MGRKQFVHRGEEWTVASTGASLGVGLGAPPPPSTWFVQFERAGLSLRGQVHGSPPGQLRDAALGVALDRARLLHALHGGSARTIGELASDTGIPPSEVESALDAMPDQVDRSLDSADRRYFRVDGS